MKLSASSNTCLRSDGTFVSAQHPMLLHQMGATVLLCVYIESVPHHTTPHHTISALHTSATHCTFEREVPAQMAIRAQTLSNDGMVWHGVVWCGVVWCGALCSRTCHASPIESESESESEWAWGCVDWVCHVSQL